MDLPPVLNFGDAPGDGYFSSSYITGLVQAAIAAAQQGAGTAAENAYIQAAVQNASSLLNSKDCAGLFLTPDQKTSPPIAAR